MMPEPKTIAEQIDCLARLTGAPRSFVMQVKELFSRKGIPLESDASPYLRALEEAFKREETIRTNAARAKENVQRLASNFNRMGRTYARQLEQLKRIQSELRAQNRKLTPGAEEPADWRSTRSADGNRHTFMTRQISDNMPMVPGPEEEQ
jgi:hypothetical protein